MRRLAVSIAAALVALAAAAPAPAAVVYVIDGHGFGHGIGMSQYGAYGYARHHVGYERILRHYYRGTALAKVSPQPVRVLLQAGGAISFTSASRVNGHPLDPARTYVVSLRGNGTDVRDARGREVQSFGAGALYASGRAGHVRLLGPALNGTSGGAYRGQLEIVAAGGALDAINVLGLEDYVASVVPSEVFASWPLAALEAQAVAARTYALANRTTELFDEYADTRSQMYKGISAEAARSSAATRATAGQVVTYRGRLMTTYFFSASGGRTENVENVFYGSPHEPYLVSVRDPYDSSAPLHSWQFRLSQHEIAAKLARLCTGAFERIHVLRRGVSPRVVSADVVCSGGTRRTTGVELKGALGLYDTWFYETRIATSAHYRPRGADFLAQVLQPPRSLNGTFDPAPPGRHLVVEREQRGSFARVGSVDTSADGAFLYPVWQPGVYRVRYGGAAGPIVRVR